MFIEYNVDTRGWVGGDHKILVSGAWGSLGCLSTNHVLRVSISINFRVLTMPGSPMDSCPVHLCQRNIGLDGLTGQEDFMQDHCNWERDRTPLCKTKGRRVSGSARSQWKYWKVLGGQRSLRVSCTLPPSLLRLHGVFSG